MKCKLLMVVFLVLGVMTVAQIQAIPDPDGPDTLRVVSTEVASAVSVAQKVVVDVTFYNDEQISAITYPMQWETTDNVTLDSVSFVGSRVNYLATKPVTIDNTAHNVKIGAIVFFEAYIPAGDGLFCKLYFDIAAGTPDQVITLDTVTIAPAYYTFNTTTGATFVPKYSVGYLTVGGVAVDDNKPAVPASYNLSQNYPNPFNPTTIINYSLERKGNVEISIFNILGQRVVTLVDGEMEAGPHSIEWKGTDQYGGEVASGIYFYKMVTEKYTDTRKMVLMR